ncbi:hypothetical protein POTOM_040745 [Populus tomentosa]|uniref:Uncharacterized protein n=1 Tax=Populus tomentosa TaxID=118781 RepID=A0A8X8CHX1_POPTO|nr:hypothetical protein POTOM_040745 [Populus tomentosa]
MMLNPLVSSPSLYDIASTPGVAADVSHINSRTDQVLSGIIKSLSIAISKYCPNVSSFWGDLISYEMGIWFLMYSALLYMLIVDGLDFLDHKALVNLISNPVNSTIPIAAGVFKKA